MRPRPAYHLCCDNCGSGDLTPLEQSGFECRECSSCLSEPIRFGSLENLVEYTAARRRGATIRRMYVISAFAFWAILAIAIWRHWG